MTKPSPFSVRGRRALMAMRDDRDISIVRRQLNRLGMAVTEHDPSVAPPAAETIDVIVMDTDSIPIKSDAAVAWKIGVPIIALIGTETPSRLKWLLDLQPASFLIKPLRSAGLYTALVVARSMPPSEELMKPLTLKDWKIVFVPGASCSPPCCRSWVVTACPNRRPSRLSGKPRCGTARRSSN